MSDAKQTVILCEGYNDRAFLKGWLLRLGCTEQKEDPFRIRVSSGQFGFDTPTKRFLRIAPGHGDDNVLALIGPTLKERATKPLDWLVVNLDCDSAHDDNGEQRARRVQSVVERFGASGSVRSTGLGRYVLEDETNLGVILWETADPPAPELPSKQTLERLACAALRDVYPDRAKAVEAWLRMRPNPGAEGCEALGEKAFAWSHMAGWFSEHGCDEFYQRMWRTEPIARALEERLSPSGARELVSALCD
jgi:hypothetical protein